MKFRIIVNAFVLVLTFLMMSEDSYALISVEDVSPDRANELGIDVRATPSGPNAAWIVLELKAEGELKDFQHVSMEFSDGEGLLLGSCPLKSHPSQIGTVFVRFMVNREMIKNVTLRVLEGQHLNDSGHDLKLKEFIDLEKIDEK